MNDINKFEKVLIGSRNILVVLYGGLALGLGAYSYKFMQELYELIISIHRVTTEIAMLSLLGLVDIVMLANLVVMIYVGGYSIFIKELNPKSISHRPRFMNHITASGLKVKMGSSLIGVSSIHLLKKFVEIAESHEDINIVKICILIGIHLVFIVSTVALSYIDKPYKPGKDESESKDVH
jgi:uncharacterized protein (TIGR00645 family)